MFAQFMDKPADFMTFLQTCQNGVAGVFKN
jgi:hypothetical protein